MMPYNSISTHFIITAMLINGQTRGHRRRHDAKHYTAPPSLVTAPHSSRFGWADRNKFAHTLTSIRMPFKMHIMQYIFHHSTLSPADDDSALGALLLTGTIRTVHTCVHSNYIIFKSEQLIMRRTSFFVRRVRRRDVVCE